MPSPRSQDCWRSVASAARGPTTCSSSSASRGVATRISRLWNVSPTSSRGAAGGRLAAGAPLETSVPRSERIGAARPDLPLVPMGYANQVIGGGDGEAVATRLARAGAAGLIVADLTPDEGASFEGVSRAAG